MPLHAPFRSFPQEEEESSEDGDESSDYSSANESFLDEDPASKNLPEVLGALARQMSSRNLGPPGGPVCAAVVVTAKMAKTQAPKR